MLGMVAPARDEARAGLVGRPDEHAALEAAVRGLREPACRAVHVSGEPGIGKTALIRAVLDGSGVRVLWCTGDALGQQHPFGMLLDGLAAGGDPAPRPVGTLMTESEQVVASQLVERIGRLVDAEPLVIVVDDLHWADEFTLRLLPRLAASFRTRPLLLVTAGHRHLTAEAWRLFSVLSRYCSCTELGLAPLAPAHGWLLAKRILGHDLTPADEQIFGTAGGNPLLIERVAASLAAQADSHALGPGTSSDTWAAPRLPLNQLPHLSVISEDCVRFLGLASVLGPGFDMSQLEVVTGQPLLAVVGLVREAVDAGLLGEELGQLRFRHELVRASLAADLPSAVRSALHRLVARDLIEKAADPERAVEHLLEAALGPADFEWVHSAATACAEIAPGPALSLWAHLIEQARLTDDLDPRRVDVDTRMALAHFSLGQVRHAEGLARAVLERGGARHVSALRRCLAMALILQGRWHEARALTETSAIADDLQPWERAEQTALAGAAALLAGDTPAAVSALNRAERAAIVTGSEQAMVRVLVTRGHHAHCSGDLHEARALLTEAARLTAGEGSPATQEAFAPAFLGLVLTDLDRVDEGSEVFEEGRRLGLERGSAISVRVTEMAQSVAAVSVGALERAAAALDRDLAQVDEPIVLWQPLQMARRALVGLYCDGPEAAEVWLRRIGSARDGTEVGYGMAWRARATAAVRLARGDAEGALSLLWRSWLDVMAHGILIDSVVLAPELVDAAVRVGDAAKGNAVAECLEELALRNPDVVSLEAGALTARGILTDDVDALVAAAAAARRSPRLLTSARSAEAAALALARSGGHLRAHQLCREALALYSSGGAGFEAARARAAFRQAGIRVREPARSRPRSGWEALTPAEQVVARYVEQGLTNGDIADELVVSRRTVESHVSHVLAKLGLRSRADLILAAARRVPSQAKGSEVESR